MWNTWYLLGIILWVIFAFWPAMVAKRKGHSFVLYFLFSLVFFFIALIAAYMASDRTMTPQERAADQAADEALAKEEGF